MKQRFCGEFLVKRVKISFAQSLVGVQNSMVTDLNLRRKSFFFKF